MRAFLALIATLLALTLPTHADPTYTNGPTQDPGRFVEIAAVPTANIAPPHVTVWLPPGYDVSTRHYPVVYMHDGQNLFFPERSNFHKVWAADKSALRLIAARRTGPFIIVGIDQPGEARYRQYFPESVAANASPELRAKIARLAKGPLAGDKYLAFLSDDLKPLIDRQYRTLPDPAHTAIVGSSMGGLISCYAFVRAPAIFGRAGCVSTHWPLGDPEHLGGYRPDVAQLWRDWFAANLGSPAGRRLWMDHGTATLDANYAPYQQAIDQQLAVLHWRKGKDFESRTYQGAAHEENAWAARMDDLFGWLLSDWR